MVRAGWAGEGELRARIPELTHLGGKSIGIVGLGCVGAPSALEFVRTGVGSLHLMDGDYVEAGMTVRWPLGLSAAGKSKVEAIRDFVKNEYPYTQIQSFDYQLGQASEILPAEQSILEKFLFGLDLLYDASAEIGVSYFLSEMASKENIPYISASTTAGGWGGRVLRIAPRETRGCWFCFQTALTNGTIETPPADEKEFVQPAGCAAPTFTGASFDIWQIALAGVRLAVSTLSEGGVGGYPKCEWDIGVLSLRDSAGGLLPPTWRTYEIEQQTGCPRCGQPLK